MEKLKLKMPSGLSDDAKKMWREIVPQLLEAESIKKIDAPNLEALCFWWGVFSQCRKQMDGIIDYGSMDATRLSGNLTRAWDAYRRLCDEFGLTPLARIKVEVNEPTQGTPGAKFFNGGA